MLLRSVQMCMSPAMSNQCSGQVAADDPSSHSRSGGVIVIEIASRMNTNITTALSHAHNNQHQQHISV